LIRRLNFPLGESVNQDLVQFQLPDLEQFEPLILEQISLVR